MHQKESLWVHYLLLSVWQIVFFKESYEVALCNYKMHVHLIAFFLSWITITNGSFHFIKCHHLPKSFIFRQHQHLNILNVPKTSTNPTAAWHIFTAQFSAVCPPKAAKMPSGFSRSMTFTTNSGVTGRKYTRSAMPGRRQRTRPFLKIICSL